MHRHTQRSSVKGKRSELRPELPPKKEFVMYVQPRKLSAKTKEAILIGEKQQNLEFPYLSLKCLENNPKLPDI